MVIQEFVSSARFLFLGLSPCRANRGRRSGIATSRIKSQGAFANVFMLHYIPRNNIVNHALLFWYCWATPRVLYLEDCLIYNCSSVVRQAVQIHLKLRHVPNPWYNPPYSSKSIISKVSSSVRTSRSNSCLSMPVLCDRRNKLFILVLICCWIATSELESSSAESSMRDRASGTSVGDDALGWPIVEFAGFEIAWAFDSSCSSTHGPRLIEDVITSPRSEDSPVASWSSDGSSLSISGWTWAYWAKYSASDLVLARPCTWASWGGWGKRFGAGVLAGVSSYCAQ